MGGARSFVTLCTSGDPVFISPIDDEHRPEDTQLVIQDHRGASARLRISSGEVAFLPTALVIAFILSTPSSWAQRGRGLLAGLLLVNGFIVLRIAVMVLYTHSLLVSMGTSAPPTFWSKTFAAAIQFVGVGQGLSCIMAVLIWVLILLCRRDLNLLLPEAGPRPHDPVDS